MSKFPILTSLTSLFFFSQPGKCRRGLLSANFTTNKITTGLVVLLFTALVWPVSSARATSLSMAVQKALQDNPDMLVAVKEKRRVDTGVREAYAGYLPSVDFQGSVGPEYTEDRVTRLSGTDDSEELVAKTASISLRQMIFDGLETPNQVDKSIADAQAASYRLQARAEQVGLDVAKAYIEIVRRSRITQLARHNVRVHEKYLAMVKQRAESGVGSSADISQAQSRLGQAKTTLVNALSRLKDGVASFERLVGSEPFKLKRPKMPLDSIPADLSQAVAMAEANNPMVLAAERDTESAYFEAESRKSPFLPRFDVELDGSAGDNLGGVREDETNLSALLVMRYNLYNGGADTARQRAAIFERSRLQSVMDRVKRLVAEETKFSWNAMMSARDRVYTLQDVVNSNIQVRDAYLEQFELGQRTLLDLLDSENELYLSRNELTNVRYETLFETYRLLTALGGLLDTLEVRMPEQFAALANNAFNREDDGWFSSSAK